jgi:RNA-binding protein
MNKQIKELSRKTNTLEPSIIIGKGGITENTVKAIKEHLKNKRLIKVKILGSFIKDKDKKNVFSELAEKTDSEIVQKVGFVVTLHTKEEKDG